MYMTRINLISVWLLLLLFKPIILEGLVNVNYPNDGLVGTNTTLYGNLTTVVEGLNHLELLDNDGLHSTLNSFIRGMSLMRPIVFPIK